MGKFNVCIPADCPHGFLCKGWTRSRNVHMLPKSITWCKWSTAALGLWHYPVVSHLSRREPFPRADFLLVLLRFTFAVLHSFFLGVMRFECHPFKRQGAPPPNVSSSAFTLKTLKMRGDWSYRHESSRALLNRSPLPSPNGTIFSILAFIFTALLYQFVHFECDLVWSWKLRGCLSLR